jgi:hypothetical protein
LIRNNVAAADVLIDWTEAGGGEPHPDLLSEADQLSAQARDTLPWMPHTRGTRGSVLIVDRGLKEGQFRGRGKGQGELPDEARKGREVGAAYLAVGFSAPR